MSVLAIDFGTSRIKAAYWDEVKGEAVVLPLGKGGRLYVPSLFHVSKDGKIRFGDEAEVMLHHDSSGVVENLKLDLDKPIKHVPNGQQVKSGELMALLFRRIIDFGSRQIPSFGGNAPKTLILTLPSRWDYGDIYMDALESIGYKGEKIVIREPEAAGLAWIEEKKPKVGDMLVVLDFGGGTVDWACLRIDEKGRPSMIADLPSGGITAAGVHVDAGLLDEMMQRISEEQRREVQQHRAQVLEQIRQIKESQNGGASLSGEDGLLEVQLVPEPFIFSREVYEAIIRREAIDQAVEGIGGYVKKVIKIARDRNKELSCVMAGGTRLLSGLEERVKERIMEIGKSSGVAMTVASIAQADFATVRGAVLRGTLTRHREKEINVQSKQRSSSVDVPENFVLIRGGEFTMGSPKHEPERRSDEMQHQVKVSDFYMGRYAVTFAEFKEFIEECVYSTDAEKSNSSVILDGGFKAKGGINWRHGVSGNMRTQSGYSHPVVHVSWNDAVAYCLWQSSKTGKTYRLPTEAEWEYACRAGTTTPFSKGGNLTTDQANYNGNFPYDKNRKGLYRENTVSVDSFSTNAWSLSNMHGNVWEWCSDWYDSNYYDKCKAKGIVENPAGPSSVSYRVLRGGSWSDDARHCRSSYRSRDTPVYHSSHVGFRLVLVPW
jgi:formylglycine-generating enzyme required for sulfatase activity